MKITLKKKIQISSNSKPIVIAEISGNHGGNKKNFLKHIVTASKNGADLVKIQTYEPEDITIKNFNKKFLIKKGIWKNKSLWEIYKKAYTPFSWHKDAFKVARRNRIILFSSPFSKRAVDLLEKFKVPVYKIASMEITDFQLIDYIAQKNKPIILSTGMSSIDEVKKAIKVIRKYHNKIIILYCVSGYPTKEKDSNLNTLRYYKKVFKNYNVGISDHTDDIITSLTASALGAKVIEKHFIISKKSRTVDSKFSIDAKQLKELQSKVQRVHQSLGGYYKKIQKVEKDNLKYRRSIFAIKNIKKGEKLTEKNIASFRPKIGINSNRFFRIIGRKVKSNIKKFSPIFEKEIKR